MPQVKIPPPYQGPTEGKALIDVTGANVGECLESLCAAYPTFRPLLFDGSAAVHGFVTLFINGDEIDRAALDSAVAESDEIEILAAIAGG